MKEKAITEIENMTISNIPGPVEEINEAEEVQEELPKKDYSMIITVAVTIFVILIGYFKHRNSTIL
ncbi:MAG: hypothetical protein Q8R04_03610 [Nanoarchaeota archaeon]|nr:hypothetical protein [Nanoarchaeota archaeon]